MNPLEEKVKEILNRALSSSQKKTSKSPPDERIDCPWERNKIRNFIASSKLEGIILDPDGEMQRKEDAYWAERDKREKNATVS